MRYQAWDVLVFPDPSKVPMQEFKVGCQVIQDLESHASQVNTHLLPTVTCFIASLPAGSPFRVSIHSWQNPETSQYVRNLCKPSDHVIFEARVFVDGRMAGSRWFDKTGPWPTIVDFSIDLDKQGEPEKLKFPSFHKELLTQSYWNAGDDLGRVKVVISEGFPRENPSYPFERVKNVVSFSFQHAPLDVLESSSIAWPNAAMWRQVPLVGPYKAQQSSPTRAAVGAPDIHSHSPRRATRVSTKHATAVSTLSNIFPPPAPILPRQSAFDPFTEPSNSAFAGWRQVSSDVSMLDYSSSSSNTRASGSRNVSDPTAISIKQIRRHESIETPGGFQSLCEKLAPPTPAVPVNTPENTIQAPLLGPAMVTGIEKPSIKMEIGPSGILTDAPTDLPDVFLTGNTTETDALYKTHPFPEKVEPTSRGSPSTTAVANEVERATSSSLENSVDPFVASLLPHKEPQELDRENVENVGNHKRQRVITPASTKVIDDTDVPRSSPSMRKISGMSVKQDDKQNERSILGALDNV